jgi:hypothetical protein
MTVLSKWTAPKRWFLLWNQKTKMMELVRLNYKPGLAEDKFQKKAWEIQQDIEPIGFKIKNKIHRCILLDADRAVGVNIEPDGDLLKIRANPDLVGQMVDAVMVTQAYQITPSRKMIIIGFIAGLFFGVLFGMGM